MVNQGILILVDLGLMLAGLEGVLFGARKSENYLQIVRRKFHSAWKERKGAD
ncbi:hypothetical protein D3C76_628400 [compost metagenome]